MSWRDAPLYTEAFDLSRWVMERTGSWPHEPLARLATRSACNLVTAVSLALTFPQGREQHLERADVGIVELRTLLRLAQSLALVSRGGLRFATARLATIGRMVGGWRKRMRKEMSGARRAQVTS